MKVKELIEHLSKLDADMDVVVSGEHQAFDYLQYAPSVFRVDPREIYSFEIYSEDDKDDVDGWDDMKEVVVV
jgi:hypothetical protein